MKAAFLVLALAFAVLAAAVAQEGPFPALRTQLPAEQGEGELDQLLAPVALYPDSLLANVFVASTYPLEVVALHRWLEAHPGLSGDALDQALAPHSWDASVKALAPFGSVVAMMDGELEWTQRLGDAFLSREAEVWSAVQRLRKRARAAGNLADNQRERVMDEGTNIIIEPAQPDTVYVPVYDPRVVYGPWAWPEYPPYVWGWPYWGPLDFYYGGIGFGVGIYWGSHHDGHAHPDWHNRGTVWNHGGTQAAWTHDPGHRRGVPYVNPGVHDRYSRTPPPRQSAPARGDYRGFDVAPRTRQATPLTPAPRPNVRQESQRGHESLRSAPPASRSSAPRSQGSTMAPSKPAPSSSRGGGVKR